MNIKTWHQNILNDPQGEGTFKCSSYLFSSVLHFVIESRLYYENSYIGSCTGPPNSHTTSCLISPVLVKLFKAGFTCQPVAIHSAVSCMKKYSEAQHHAVSSADAASKSHVRPFGARETDQGLIQLDAHRNWISELAPCSATLRGMK